VNADVRYVSTSAPFMYSDPISGQPHLAYLSGTSVWHTWYDGSSWGHEPVAAAAQMLDWAVGPSGRGAAAYTRTGGVLVCARRGVGGWSEDTVMVVPTGTIAASLAVDPESDEPVLAILLSRPSGLGTLYLARHAAGGWSTVELDTAAVLASGVSLALDPDGLPHLAYMRMLSATDDAVLHLEPTAPMGPFATQALDTLSNEHPTGVSIALDPVSGDPRVAYCAWEGHLYYAYRMPGGSWQAMLARPSASWPAGPVSLAVDGSGNPSIAWTCFVNIGPQLAPGDRAEADCGIVGSYVVDLLERVGGTGSTPFSLHDYSTGTSFTSPRAVGFAGPRQTRACWLSGMVLCPPPWAVKSGVYTALADVEASEPGGEVVSLPAPNPLRSGQTLRFRLALPHPARVACELIDLAGRRVARRPEVPLPQGAHDLEWTPEGLGPGCYWLRARTPTAVLGTRPLIVTR
jgi:hypothetical protein